MLDGKKSTQANVVYYVRNDLMHGFLNGFLYFTTAQDTQSRVLVGKQDEHDRERHGLPGTSSTVSALVSVTLMEERFKFLRNFQF